MAAGLIEKTERQYKGTIVRLLGEMRRSGQLPYQWLVDSSRSMYKPRSYNSPQDALDEIARLYRRNIWPELGERVEIWTEKETLTGALIDETYLYNVPLMPTRGYPSLSYLYEAAELIKSAGVPTYIYYFGDLDPSGVDIPKYVMSELREHVPDTEIHFECLAVQERQVERVRFVDASSKDYRFAL